MDNKGANLDCEERVDSKKEDFGSFLQSRRRVLFWIITAIVCLAICIYFFLPSVFILLDHVFPGTYDGTGALQQLSDNINSAVGMVSLAVGVFSIKYAYDSNKRMEKHTQDQDSFLQEITETSKLTYNGVVEGMKKTNAIYDKMGNPEGYNSKDKAKDELETD